MRVFLIGGTGVISRCITEQLLEKNHEVVLFNRGQKQLSFSGEVEQLTGDRANQEQFESCIKQSRADVVMDMICFNEEDARSTVRACRDRVEQIIVCSSVAAYKRPYHSVPTVEEQEELFDNPAFGYAFHKAEMERYLNRVIEQDKLPVTILRPSLTYGIGAANIGVFRQNYGILQRIRQGKPLVMFGDGTTPWNFTFAPDVAKGFALAVGNRKTYGESYHITHQARHIWEDLYLELGRLAGREPRIIHISSELLLEAAPNLCAHLYYEKTYAGLFDTAKLTRDIPEFQATVSLAEGLRMVADWWEREALAVDDEKDLLEDRLASAYQGWAKEIAGLYVK